MTMMIMRLFLTLLAVIGTVAPYILEQQNDVHFKPPQPNPNIQREFDTRAKKPELEKSEDASGLSDASCDMNSIISASGNSLAELVKNTNSRCINNIFDLEGDKAKNTCNEPDMNSVANAFYGATYSYDANNAGNTPGILSLTLYLRACYYIQSNNEKLIGNYSNNLLSLLRYGLDNFFNRPNLDAKKTAHYEIAKEVITLITNARDSLNYVGKLSKLLTTLSASWTFESSIFFGQISQSDVVYAIYDVFSRSHSNTAEVKAYHCQHTETPWSLNEFMDRHANMVGTNSEWILRNTGGELAKFLAYDCLYSQVSGYIKNQMSKYSPNKGDKVWATLASKINEYDKKNCAQYNVCNFQTDIEKKILPITKSCDKTYKDTFVIRAQSVSASELEEVCKRLKAQESYFHTLVSDNWAPVVPDTNDKIEVIIFDDSDEYKFYAWLLFDISTDNGGMYLEGDPSKPGNIARYFCYEQPKNGKFDVWNLEHEFTHYLDGRYNMKGDFTDTNKPMTVWWGEGFAEYAANKDQYPSMVYDCKDKLYPLSTIFNNNYNSGTARIYHYGYLAARFMFERHRSDVNTILKYFRAGQLSEYQSWFNGVYNRYDQEFSNWCTCIANGKPCP